MEGEKDSESFGARITRNGVLDRKLWAFEAMGAKWPFQEVLGAYLKFYERLKSLGAKI
jgi:hypothetical protein